ncbi:MAG: flagellar basal body-associated FliL family protein [Alphaproteobacteria bacterium]|nr:flagellar basal body-associated FliL family protein [Alphaproteobacteria bacterium]
MADEDDEEDYEDDDEDGEDDDEEGEGGKGGLSGKQTVLFVALPVALLIGIGAWLFISGVFSGGDGDEAADGTVAEDGSEAGGEGAAPGAAAFYEMPELLVNLNTTGRRSSFLKIKVSLELASQAEVAKLEVVMPRVVDNFQVYLRELRAEDLRGSAGIHRLREELLARVKVAAQPAVVNDVLFKEILVQ